MNALHRHTIQILMTLVVLVSACSPQATPPPTVDDVEVAISTIPPETKKHIPVPAE